MPKEAKKNTKKRKKLLTYAAYFAVLSELALATVGPSGSTTGAASSQLWSAQRAARDARQSPFAAATAAANLVAPQVEQLEKFKHLTGGE